MNDLIFVLIEIIYLFLGIVIKSGMKNIVLSG
jgi:hypothetical protein